MMRTSPKDSFLMFEKPQRFSWLKSRSLAVLMSLMAFWVLFGNSASFWLSYAYPSHFETPFQTAIKDAASEEKQEAEGSSPQLIFKKQLQTDALLQIPAFWVEKIAWASPFFVFEFPIAAFFKIGTTEKTYFFPTTAHFKALFQCFIATKAP
ncbi:hypothetical protein [Hugenholtzia roseola]|uniref:hypothetical protein n=1 Tax=Hugenholtzia roseola TaxID=1002 RepID=UPI0012B649D6|nr:hypothetical protein [Hugenholtzia roseola]